MSDPIPQELVRSHDITIDYRIRCPHFVGRGRACLHVAGFSVAGLDVEGAVIPGEIILGDGEQSREFAPRAPWERKTYSLSIDERLEGWPSTGQGLPLTDCWTWHPDRGATDGVSCDKQRPKKSKGL